MFVIIYDILMAFLFKCILIYIYYTMEREGPISYSDSVNLTTKCSQNMYICISFMQTMYMHSINVKKKTQ